MESDTTIRHVQQERDNKTNGLGCLVHNFKEYVFNFQTILHAFLHTFLPTCIFTHVFKQQNTCF